MKKWMIKKGIEQGLIYFDDEKIPYKNVVIGNVGIFIYDMTKSKFVSGGNQLVDVIYEKYNGMSGENKNAVEGYLNDHIVLYSDGLMETLRNALGLEEDDTSRDDEILEMDKDDVFELALYQNGISGFADTIKNMVWDIYGIENFAQ